MAGGLKKRVMIILLFTIVVELIILLALTGYWHLSRIEQMAPQESKICIPMIKFKVIDENNNRILVCPDGLKELTVNGTEVRKSCCGNMSVVLKTVTDEIVYDKYDSDAAPEIAALDIKAFNCFETKTIPMKTHLVGLSSEAIQQDHIKSSSKLLWNIGQPSYIHSGLRYLVNSGNVYIENNGYFHISSQLRSKIKNTNCTSAFPCRKFRHFIYRIRRSGERQVLLERDKSSCEISTDVYEFTSAIGAVFKLETGDQLYVSISHPNSILSDVNDNYFSIHSV